MQFKIKSLDLSLINLLQQIYYLAENRTVDFSFRLFLCVHFENNEEKKEENKKRKSIAKLQLNHNYCWPMSAGELNSIQSITTNSVRANPSYMRLEK